MFVPGKRTVNNYKGVPPVVYTAGGFFITQPNANAINPFNFKCNAINSNAMQLRACRKPDRFTIKVCNSNCQISRVVVGKNLQLKIQLTHCRPY
jgi:hypothetical protein